MKKNLAKEIYGSVNFIKYTYGYLNRQVNSAWYLEFWLKPYLLHAFNNVTKTPKITIANSI